MRAKRLAAGLLVATSAGYAQSSIETAPVATPQSATAAASSQPQGQQPQVQQAAALLRAGQPQQALTLLQQIIAQDPANAPANLLAASAEIALYQPVEAVRYAERAQTLEPANWKVHTTLVTAYAMAGNTSHRDQERALLRKAHDNPNLPDARETSGFLLDLFRIGRYKVEAVEYFRPLGRYNTYYRFIIRNDAGAKVWTIEINSDSLNQTSWAQAYPRQAAEGQRQFQIESAQGEAHVEYGTFSGAPGYDYARAQVVKILTAQTAPFPGEQAAAK